MDAVVVDNLMVRYGAVTAVDHVGFTASAGEVTALLGPNGAGKTSTIEVLEGYLAPTEGQVRVLGHDPRADAGEVVGRIGVMLQDGGVYPGIYPPEMLRLLAAMYDDPLDPDNLLHRVGLASQTRTTWRQLSGGEKQRLSLAMAIIGRPEIVFLDEPTAGVDVRGRQTIRTIISELADAGTAVLLCTHELDEAEKLADRVVVIDHGKVVATGSLDELRSQTSGVIRFSTGADIDVAVLGDDLGATVVQVTPGEYTITTIDPDPSMAARLTAWLAERSIPLGDLRAGRQRLEDVFLALTAEADDPPPAEPRSGDRGRRRIGGRR